VKAEIRDRWFLVLTLLVVGHFLFSASRLVYPHFELNYPFLGGDTWVWLSNGFAIAGYDVPYSARPPVVPLLLAILEHFSILGLFPVVLQAIVHATTLGLYCHLVRDYPRRIAFAVAMTIGFNFYWRSFSLPVMADVPAACFLAWSAFFWRRSDEFSGAYVLAGVMACVSSLTQLAALLVPIPVFLSMWCFRRSKMRSWPFVVAATPLLLLPICLVALKYLGPGTGADILWGRDSLLAFNTDAIDDYLYGFVAFFGLPAAVAVGVGYLLCCRKARSDPWSLFLVSLVGVLSGFFVFFYDFICLRFLTYVFLLCAIPLAEALNRVRARMVFWPVVGIVALGSLSPVPGGRYSGYAVLWPLPPIIARAPVLPTRNSGTGYEASKLVPIIGRPAELLRHSYESLIMRHFTMPRKRPFPYERVAADRSVLLFREQMPPRQPHGIEKFRMLVQLRKRVQELPWEVFPPDLFRHRVRLSPVGRVERYTIYRGSPAGLEGTWLMVAVSGGRTDRHLAAICREGEGSPLSPGPELAQARAVSERVGSDRPVIFADPDGGDHWRLYLPFLLSTGELFLIESDQVPRVRPLWLEHSRILDRAVVGGVQMTRGRVQGRTWIVMENES